MEDSLRLFNCAYCHTQVCICRTCDRGQIYCGHRCARIALFLSHRQANQRYQQTFRGRLLHAARQARYRERKRESVNKVTDQGSQRNSFYDLLALFKKPVETASSTAHPGCCCHFCQRAVSSWIRNNFLGRSVFQGSVKTMAWAQGP